MKFSTPLTIITAVTPWTVTGLPTELRDRQDSLSPRGPPPSPPESCTPPDGASPDAVGDAPLDSCDDKEPDSSIQYQWILSYQADDAENDDFIEKHRGSVKEKLKKAAKKRPKSQKNLPVPKPNSKLRGKRKHKDGEGLLPRGRGGKGGKKQDPPPSELPPADPNEETLDDAEADEVAEEATKGTSFKIPGKKKAGLTLKGVKKEEIDEIIADEKAAGNNVEAIPDQWMGMNFVIPENKIEIRTPGRGRGRGKGKGGGRDRKKLESLSETVEGDEDSSTADDATPDTGSGSTPDTGSDSTSDTGSDSTSDTGSDSTPDTGSDSTPDTGSGSTPDTGSEGGSDGAAPDAGSDDAAPDTGSGEDTPTEDTVPEDVVVDADGEKIKVHVQKDAPWGLANMGCTPEGEDPTTTWMYGDSPGKGVYVYVIDTGVNPHTDLEGRLIQGATFVEDTTPEGLPDGHGHGTHVAGSVAGTNVGIAKNATIIGVKVLASNGYGTMSGLLAAIDWSVQHAIDNGKAETGEAIINFSLGGGRNEYLNNAINAAVDKGITCVVAAGNARHPASYYSPASAPKAVTVGAIGRELSEAWFSNYGPEIDVYAPGVDILSLSKDGTSYIPKSGTSMASPHVAGLGAYLRSFDSSLTTPALLEAAMKKWAAENEVENIDPTSTNVRALVCDRLKNKAVPVEHLS